MKTFYWIIWVFASLPCFIFAQKQDYNWTFSNNIGINFSDLNNPTLFNTVIDDGIYIAGLPQTSISDSSGKLLFYYYCKPYTLLPHNSSYCGETEIASGSSVINSANAIILSGNQLYGSGRALSLDHPLSDYKYLFTTAVHFTNGIASCVALYYHTINKGLDGNLYLANSNVCAYSSPFIHEKIAATRHSNGLDWWLLIYDQANCCFVRFLLTATGLKGPYLQAANALYIGNRCLEESEIVRPRGAMGFRLDGNELAFTDAKVKPGVATIPFNPNPPDTFFHYIDTFEFDRCTGLLSNKYKVLDKTLISKYDPGFPLSCTYSPNGKFLYVSTYKTLYKFYLSPQSDTIPYNVLYDIDLNTDEYSVFHTELGPDGKIYCIQDIPNDAIFGGLSIIHDPDSFESALDIHGFNLNGKSTGMALPHFPNFRLKASVGAGRPYVGLDKVICAGDSVRLGAVGTAGQLYRWYPADGLSDTTVSTPWAKPTVSTTYTLYAEDSIGGICGGASDTVRVFVNELSFTPEFGYTADGLTVAFTPYVPDTAAYSFLWKFGSEGTSTETSPVHTYAQPGLKTVSLTVTDSTGCASRTVSRFLSVSAPNETEYQAQVSGIKVYPNPTRGVITVHCPQPEAAGIELFDATGRVVLRTTVLFPHTELDIAHLPAGIYTIKIGNSSTKFVKQE